MASVEPIVLVVDDRADESFALEETLRDMAVVVVRSPAEAMSDTSAVPAAAIVRIELAGGDGFEVAERLRRHVGGRPIPLLFVTALPPGDATVRRAYSLGAVDVLVEPVEPVVLRAKVGVLADSYRSHRDAELQGERLLVAQRREHEQGIAVARAGLDAATVRARIEGERRSSERLELVAETATALLGGDDPRRTLAGRAQRLLRGLDLDLLVGYCSVPDSRRLARFASAGIDDCDDDVGISECPFIRELIASRQRWMGDASGPNAPPWLRRLGTASCVVWPLTTADRVLGVLICGRRRGTIGTDELAAMQVIALQVERALEHSRLTQELRERTLALADDERRKNEFLDLLGHELRNPLAPLAYASRLMGTHGPGDACFARLCEVVTSQVQVLTRLVDDLLDVSSLGVGEVELACEPISVNALLERAIAASAPVVEARRHELVVRPLEVDCEVVADVGKMARAVESLVENAARYTDPGGRIEVTAQRARGELRIVVRDNGRGIAPEDAPRIFDTFVRAGATHAHSGLGLGLPLVRGMVEMHGGRVTATSAGRGQGSEVVISLRVG